jgi:hypothetical protein
MWALAGTMEANTSTQNRNARDMDISEIRVDDCGAKLAPGHGSQSFSRNAVAREPDLFALMAG